MYLGRYVQNVIQFNLSRDLVPPMNPSPFPSTLSDDDSVGVSPTHSRSQSRLSFTPDSAGGGTETRTIPLALPNSQVYHALPVIPSCPDPYMSSLLPRQIGVSRFVVVTQEGVGVDTDDEVSAPQAQSHMILDMNEGMSLTSGIPSTVTSESGRSRRKHGGRSRLLSSVFDNSDVYSADENQSFSQRRGRLAMSVMSADSRSVEGLSERSSVDVLLGSSDSSGEWSDEGELVDERGSEVVSDRGSK